MKDLERFDILNVFENIQKLISPNQTVLKEATLTSLLASMTLEEREDTLVVIFVAETDLEHVANISSLVEEKFPEVVTILTSTNQFFPHPAHTIWPLGSYISPASILPRFDQIGGDPW